MRKGRGGRIGVIGELGDVHLGPSPPRLALVGGVALVEHLLVQRLRGAISLAAFFMNGDLIVAEVLVVLPQLLPGAGNDGFFERL